MTSQERLAPVRSDDVSNEHVKKLLGRLESLGKDVHMAHLFANAGNVFGPYVTMSDALMNRATLAPRLRELAILQLAKLLDADYEWYEHARMSLDADVTPGEQQAILDGSFSSLPVEREAAFVVAAASEWVAGGWTFSDGTWDEGVALLGREGLTDLVFTLAWWGAWVPATVRTFRITPPVAITDES